MNKKRRLAPWIAGAVVLVLGPVIFVAATAEPAEQRIADSPLIGKTAPPVSGDVVTGTNTPLAEMAGKYVVVNFFATWCVPCRTEHPELVRFAQQHAQRDDAAVIQVVYGDRSSAVKSFIKRNGGDWPVFDDPKGTIALDWGVRGLPESYLVDPDGVVVAKIIGGASYDGLERLLRAVRG
ncbi:MAG: TlpA disulfide reductase family protein [Acidimicrobiales bacterium]|nr:TlpA disulfide reductase family protein [Acidimicrobiales bacterium]